MPLTPEQKKILAPYLKAEDISEEDILKALDEMDEDKRDGLFKALKKMAAEKKAAEAKATEGEAKAEKAETEKAERLKKIEKALGLVADDKAEDALPLLNELAGKSEIFKSDDLSPAAKREFEKAEERAKKAEEKAEANDKRIEKFEKAERTRVWTEKAEELEAMPGENKGEILAEVAEFDAELAGKVHEIFKAADGALTESGLYAEIGDNREGGKGSALAEAEALAAKYQAKADKPLTEAQAFVQVMRENRELAARVRAERDQ